jgi:hypothetical protein
MFQGRASGGPIVIITLSQADTEKYQPSQFGLVREGHWLEFFSGQLPPSPHSLYWLSTVV